MNNKLLKYLDAWFLYTCKVKYSLVDIARSLNMTILKANNPDEARGMIVNKAVKYLYTHPHRHRFILGFIN